ncbi:hypothetical protein Ahy_B10g103176 [Arachis hypogaea]|uniref:Uncharacterized protein n=1 Tax=Arachis hypogaea TaxID=3818 RepID=A0A444X3C8_ARAHY|nr:hypothetical protein Ahy_B10g103176 [Arachis hypogaea]
MKPDTPKQKRYKNILKAATAANSSQDKSKAAANSSQDKSAASNASQCLTATEETGKEVSRVQMWDIIHKKIDGSYVNEKAKEIAVRLKCNK